MKTEPVEFRILRGGATRTATKPTAAPLTDAQKVKTLTRQIETLRTENTLLKVRLMMGA